MLHIDINCDMGEGMLNDAELMRYISSANIACGFHAGNPGTMFETVQLAIKHHVAIGAHPSFPDKENFGRTEMQLSPHEVYTMTLYQVGAMDAFSKTAGAKLHHVKPHGALYNMAAKDRLLAEAIVQAVKDFNPSLYLYGLAGSELIKAAKEKNLPCCNEVFADRTYQPDGSLTSRKDPNALITNADKAVAQVIQMMEEKTITAVNGRKMAVQADTVCIHGDGTHAVEFATALNRKLKEKGVRIHPA
jgi:5-oxoprolinase (ATP-hydrolysing) subunit A